MPTVFNIGLATTAPPVAALYQTTEWPAGTVAVAVIVGTGPPEQTACAWLPPDVGLATTELPTVTGNADGEVVQVPLPAVTLTFPLLLPPG